MLDIDEAICGWRKGSGGMSEHEDMNMDGGTAKATRRLCRDRRRPRAQSRERACRADERTELKSKEEVAGIV